MSREQRIWNLGTIAILLILLLSWRMVYWQVAGIPGAEAVVSAQTTPTVTTAAAPTPTAPPNATFPVPSAVATPAPSPSPSPTLDLATITRGTIYDRNGQRLAFDQTNNAGNLVRFYAQPSLAHVIGYLSGVRRGVAGIEQALDDMLLGLTPATGGPPGQGHDVYLTIDGRIQAAAMQALSNKIGAVIVMDAPTGAILALANSPTYNPNQILDPNYLQQLENCTGANCNYPLFNRATQGLYVPGSTWKTVTLIAALDTGQVTPDTVFDFGAPLRDGNGNLYYVYTVDGFAVVDPNHPEQQLNLVRSYAVSANAAFARIGDEMPPEVMLEYAYRLGFSRNGEAPPIEIGASAARLAVNPQTLLTDNPLRAVTAIGQGELLASPLSIALMTAAVVNNGDIPRPHLVLSVANSSGVELVGEPGGYWIEDVMKPETAEQVRQMMIEVVQNGSGYQARVSGAVVGGKTGTAQLSDNQLPHAWFTGFVQMNGRTLVITVLIEHGGEGSQAAAPLFAQIAWTAMQYLGNP